MELPQMAAYPESWACFPNALSQMNLSGAPWLAWHDCRNASNGAILENFAMGK